MPEKDYYLRTGDKDIKIRDQYVAHVAKMLVLAGSTPEQFQKMIVTEIAQWGKVVKASGAKVD